MYRYIKTEGTGTVTRKIKEGGVTYRYVVNEEKRTPVTGTPLKRRYDVQE
jgi:hypothetical protein